MDDGLAALLALAVSAWFFAAALLVLAVWLFFRYPKVVADEMSDEVYRRLCYVRVGAPYGLDEVGYRCWCQSPVTRVDVEVSHN